MIGCIKDFFNCEFILTFQPGGCVEPTCTVMCFILFVIGHCSDNIQLIVLFFSSETYAHGVFIYLFIYLSIHFAGESV